LTTDAPIGVFDSGLGGLTVLRQLGLTFNNENFLYLGDTARLPYGSKSPQTIRLYLEQNIEFLLSHKVKAIVVACNSASSVITPQDTWPVPVYNVIDPGSRLAAEKTMNQKVGVIGTRATVSQASYVKAIKQYNIQIEVFQQACPLLVPIVEEGWTEDPITNLVVYRYLTPLKDAGVDTLVMGCTHYPVLRNVFKKVMGKDVELVDSAIAISELLEKDMKNQKLLSKSSSSRTIRILATDFSKTFEQVAINLMSPLSVDELSPVDVQLGRPAP
jgi:glutamate racemase